MPAPDLRPTWIVPPSSSARSRIERSPTLAVAGPSAMPTPSSSTRRERRGQLAEDLPIPPRDAAPAARENQTRTRVPPFCAVAACTRLAASAGPLAYRARKSGPPSMSSAAAGSRSARASVPVTEASGSSAPGRPGQRGGQFAEHHVGLIAVAVDELVDGALDRDPQRLEGDGHDSCGEQAARRTAASEQPLEETDADEVDRDHQSGDQAPASRRQAPDARARGTAGRPRTWPPRSGWRPARTSGSAPTSGVPRGHARPAARPPGMRDRARNPARRGRPPSPRSPLPADPPAPGTSTAPPGSRPRSASRPAWPAWLAPRSPMRWRPSVLLSHDRRPAPASTAQSVHCPVPGVPAARDTVPGSCPWPRNGSTPGTRIANFRSCGTPSSTTPG